MLILLSITVTIVVLVIVAYTFLVTPKRFFQCLNAPFKIYTNDPLDGLGAELPPNINGNQVALLVNGNEILPKMIEIIDSAESNIRWHVMLFIPDEAGLQLAEALINASARGVDVELAFDIKQSLNATIIAPYSPEKQARVKESMPIMLTDMRAAGITVLESGSGIDYPLEGLSDKAVAVQSDIMHAACLGINHLDHRKILIIDDVLAIIGGMNVGNEYLYLIPPDLSIEANDEVENRRAAGKPEAWEKWQDSAVVVSGPAVNELVQEYSIRWEILGGKPHPSPVERSPILGDTSVGVLRQRPGLHEISTSMAKLMDAAEDEIYVAYPYVSHPVLLKHLKAASERGVRVVFVFPGEYNDVDISRKLFRQLTPGLLEAGIEVYENNERMNHTKIMVVDGQYVNLGSHNFNYRSVKHDQELNLLIKDSAFANEVIERIFEPYLQQTNRLVTPYQIKQTPIDKLILPFS